MNVPDEFVTVGFKRGGEVYYKYADMICLLQRCQQGDFAMLGIEGFILDGEYLRPQMDMIADFSSSQGESWDQFKRICNESAQTFLRGITRRPELVFCCVLMNEEEWQPPAPALH